MKTQCPNCKARFNVNDKFIGKQAKCPKCTKPFTIEPFIETPVAVETPVGVETPVKSPAPTQPLAPVAPPVKISEPVVPPVKIAAPVEAPAKSTEPIASPVKVTAPVSPPTKSPEPIASPAKSAVPIKPPVKIAEPTKEEKPESKAASKALSKLLFVYCWMAVRIITGILGALGLTLAIRKEAHSTLIATFAAADVFLLCSVALELMLYYKMWAAVQDSEASISPAKAIGFLFIPVFNIYWALLMFTGFAEDYNAFKQRRSIKAKDLSFMLFLIHAFAFVLVSIVVTIPLICVLAFAGLIPRAFTSYTGASWALLFIMAAVGILHFITYILIAFKTCNAINVLPGRKSS